MIIPDITFEMVVEKTKKILGKNYREPEIQDVTESELDEITAVSENEELGTELETTDLEEICSMVIREAAQWTNRFTEEKVQEMLNDSWPVIVKCSCIAYLNRGAEGLNSQSELGQQNIYNDWVTFMHKQLTNRRFVM